MTSSKLSKSPEREAPDGPASPKSKEKRQVYVKAEMEKLGLEQARAMTSKEIDEDELMDLIEEMGEVRTEIAKIQIKKMMIERRV